MNKLLLLIMLAGTVSAVNFLPFAGFGATDAFVLVNGTLNVSVYSDDACTVEIYNKVYPNAVINGNWYVFLGNNTPESDLNLTLGQYYWRSYTIGGSNYNDSNCVRFQAVFGDERDTDWNYSLYFDQYLNTTSNVSFANVNSSGDFYTANGSFRTANGTVTIGAQLSNATTPAGMFLPVRFFSVDTSDTADAGFVIGHDGLPVWDMSTFVGENARYLHLGINYRTAETAFTISENGRIGAFKPSNYLQYHASFNGTGLDDMSVAGSYTGTTYDSFEVRANNATSFQWRYNIDNRGWSAYSANITMNGSDQYLYKGIYVRFNSTFGHTAGDTWSFNAFSLNPHSTFTITPTAFTEALYYNGSSYFDRTYYAGTSAGIPFAVLNTTSSYFYLGRHVPFLTAYFDLPTFGSGLALKAEYWNGAAWQALGATEQLVDGTKNMTQSGAIVWDYDAMPNWAVNVSVDDYNVTNSIYWIRFSTTSNAVTVPLAYSISVGFSRFEVFQNTYDVVPAFSIGADGTFNAKGYYAELYNTSTQAQTLTLQNTWYNITGWIQGEESGWTVSPENQLNCVIPGLYQVSFRVSGAVNAQNDLAYRMVINGAGEPKSFLLVHYANAQAQQISQVFLKRFNAGDYMYLQVNDTSAAGKILTKDSKSIIVTRLGN